MTKTWGPCTWYLFHTLAEKVKEESFPLIKDSLISLIIRICSNLDLNNICIKVIFVQHSLFNTILV